MSIVGSALQEWEIDPVYQPLPPYRVRVIAETGAALIENRLGNNCAGTTDATGCVLFDSAEEAEIVLRRIADKKDILPTVVRSTWDKHRP